ncbi:MAG: 50S ribosomal protein L25 [Candidatus Omnitrophota bacterium]
MEKILLKAIEREGRGKGACKHLREKGQIPAVIYKAGKKAEAIQVDSKELWRAVHTEAGSNAIITMDIASGNGKHHKKTVIVQETQRDPVKDHVIHVDFHEISLTEKLKVRVPISLKGEALGVKEDGGILTQVIWELEVECLPTAIPEHLDINVSGMKVGDAVHAKEVTLPADVTVAGDPEQVVLTISMPQEEGEEEKAEIEEGTEEPEVIKKGKKEEEGESSASAPDESKE